MNEEQWAALLRLLSLRQPQATVRELHGGTARLAHCVYCGSGQLAPCASANGLARFRCRVARGAFDVLTGTSPAQLRHKARSCPSCVDGPLPQGNSM